MNANSRQRRMLGDAGSAKPSVSWFMLRAGMPWREVAVDSVSEGKCQRTCSSILIVRSRGSPSRLKYLHHADGRPLWHTPFLQRLALSTPMTAGPV